MVEIDGLSMPTEFYVVPNHLQNVDVLIRRPVTEQPVVFVYKSPEYLTLLDAQDFRELHMCVDSNNKVKLNLPGKTKWKYDFHYIGPKIGLSPNRSRKFTAFVTPDYQYTQVPFGLSNAPAVF